MEYAMFRYDMAKGENSFGVERPLLSENFYT